MKRGAAAHHARRRGVVLVEFVLAVAVFALAALALLRQFEALTTAVTIARQESSLHQALASAMDEARARGAKIEPSRIERPDGLTIQTSLDPVSLRNDNQIELLGLQRLSIVVRYEDEPPLTAELYVAKP